MLRTLVDAAESLVAMNRAGMLPARSAGHVYAMSRSVRALGTLTGALVAVAKRTPHVLGLVDDCGSLTYSELDKRSNALARAFLDRGLSAQSVIGLLARDHRSTLDVMLAAGKVGARLVLLNTGFASQQVVDVCKREGVSFIVHDVEFSDRVAEVDASLTRYVAYGSPGGSDVEAVEALISATSNAPVPRAAEPGSIVLLTSGTTGTPKGAPRRVTSPLAIAQFLDRIPFRSGECTLIATPLFHATGYSQLVVAFALGSTVVVQHRFDPVRTLRLLDEHRPTSLVVVPTMLQRMVTVPQDELTGLDFSSLRIIFSAGSHLTPELCKRAREFFGDVVYNLYGSTEVSVVTVATPEDLRVAPGTVGRPPLDAASSSSTKMARRSARQGLQAASLLVADSVSRATQTARPNPLIAVSSQPATWDISTRPVGSSSPAVKTTW